MKTSSELAVPARRFVLGLADRSGHLDAEPLYLAAEVAGFTTTKLRLALKRMTEAGFLTLDGRGRKARISLTPVGLAKRAPDLIWIGAAYRADAGLDPWDGVWHLAAFEIPEAQRAARDALRGQITDLFGGQLSGGLYLSPLAWEPWLQSTASANGVADRLTTAQTTTLYHAGVADPARVAAAVWPVKELQADYQAFLHRWRPLEEDVPDDPYEAIRVAFEAAAEFENVFRRDPLLPTLLVPPEFVGPEARDFFLRLIKALSQHDLVANANLFDAYRSAVDTARSADQKEFWLSAYEQTSAA